jgi:pimeloyl-ACP methyl ester carboxylesterase
MKNTKAFTIVLLHGWNQNKGVWFDITEKLSSTFNVLTFDLPGFGNESKPETDWGIPEYSEWVENKILNNNLNNVVLLGHSFGGRIATHIAHKNPRWLKGLILSGAPVIYNPSFFIKTKAFLFGLLKPFAPQKIKDLFLSKEDLIARQNGMKTIRYKAITFDQSDLLNQIKVPTLIIHGQKDCAVPVKNAIKTSKIIPNNQLIILENLDHNIFIEKPLLFYGKVKNFVKNL